MRRQSHRLPNARRFKFRVTVRIGGVVKYGLAALLRLGVVGPA